MEVALVGPVDPHTPRPGGIRSYVVNLYQGLRSQDISARIHGISFSGESHSNESFTPIAIGPNVSSSKFLRSLLLRAPRMKVSEETIIHVQRPDHLLPFKFVKRKNPIVCTIHGNNLKSILKRKGRGYSGMYGLLEKVSIGRADKVLFVDSRTQESYLKKYPFLRGISSVIPVGINLEEHKLGDREELRRRFGFGKSEKVVLYVGRLEREKGPDFLLEVFAYLSTSIADTKLVLVGEGTLMPELRDFVGSLELPNVVFKGVLSRKEAFEIMKASDVLAIPSLFEAGPIVALESLASGTPVVSTDVGRVGEFLDGPMLGKIAKRKTTEFSEALEEVLGWNRDEYSEGRMKKASHFDFRKTLSQTIVAYKSLIEEPGPESEV